MNENKKHSLMYYLINPAIAWLMFFYTIIILVSFNLYFFYEKYNLNLIFLPILFVLIQIIRIGFNYISNKFNFFIKFNFNNSLYFTLFCYGLFITYSAYLNVYLSIAFLLLTLFIYFFNNSILVHNFSLALSISGFSGYLLTNLNLLLVAILVVIALFVEVYFTNKVSKTFVLNKDLNNKNNFNFFIYTRYKTSEMLMPIQMLIVDQNTLLIGFSELFCSISLCVLFVLFFNIPLNIVLIVLISSLYLSYIYKIFQNTRKSVKTVFFILICSLVLLCVLRILKIY